MDDQNTVQTAPAATHGEAPAAPTAPAAPVEPQVLNGSKVYPPSFIPVKAVLHTPKKATVWMELEHIEGIHIAFFFGLTIFLFIGMWKRPNLR